LVTSEFSSLRVSVWSLSGLGSDKGRHASIKVLYAVAVKHAEGLVAETAALPSNVLEGFGGGHTQLLVGVPLGISNISRPGW
jgi:hypothetical protein